MTVTVRFHTTWVFVPDCTIAALLLYFVILQGVHSVEWIFLVRFLGTQDLRLQIAGQASA